MRFCTFSTFAQKQYQNEFQVKLWLGDDHLINEDGVCGMHNWASLMVFSLFSPFLKRSLTNQAEVFHELLLR